MKSLPSPRVILFDWDNTLVDTWPVIHRALNATFAFMDHAPWSLEQVKRDVKHSMRDSFPALFGDRWEIAAERYQHEYRAIHMDAIAALPEAEATLDYIHAAGIFTALVSNKRGVSLRKEVESLGWNHYFKASIGSQDAPRDKPDPAPAHLALADAPITEGASIWFVGDTGVDLACGQAIGATAILYGDHTTDGMQHDGFPFHAHARTHANLKALLQS
jgi:phosphoglycolate phosphatase